MVLIQDVLCVMAARSHHHIEQSTMAHIFAVKETIFLLEHIYRYVTGSHGETSQGP